MHSALSVGQTDDFVHLNLRAHTAQPCPTLTDVRGCNILREYLAVGRPSQRCAPALPPLSWALGVSPSRQYLRLVILLENRVPGLEIACIRPHDWTRTNGFRRHGETVANRCRANSNTH